MGHYQYEHLAAGAKQPWPLHGGTLKPGVAKSLAGNDPRLQCKMLHLTD